MKRRTMKPQARAELRAFPNLSKQEQRIEKLFKDRVKKPVDATAKHQKADHE